MAYAAAITPSGYVDRGADYVILTITETGNTGVGDETTLTGLPKLGTVTMVESVLALGVGATATECDPQIGTRTNTNNVHENATAGTAPHSGTVAKVYHAASGTLYWRAKANGTLGTNGTIVSTVVIRTGHPG
jgi:hypothetical protein